MPNEIMEIRINERPRVINEIRNGVARSNRRLQKHGLNPTIFAQEKTQMLLVKPASEWMTQEYGKPMPRQLFGDFWLEGELCVLFADTNLGKSILAVQTGNNLAQGACMEPFANRMEPQTRVLYVDFEMAANSSRVGISTGSGVALPLAKLFTVPSLTPKRITLPITIRTRVT